MSSHLLHWSGPLLFWWTCSFLWFSSYHFQLLIFSCRNAFKQVWMCGLIYTMMYVCVYVYVCLQSIFTDKVRHAKETKHIKFLVTGHFWQDGVLQSIHWLTFITKVLHLVTDVQVPKALLWNELVHVSSSLKGRYMHIQTHTYTYIRTRTHTHSHTHMHNTHTTSWTK